MALVDALYKFIWASVGAPGNRHDSTHFQSTKLWEDICNGMVILDKMQVCNDVKIPPMILADSKFPLQVN